MVLPLLSLLCLRLAIAARREAATAVGSNSKFPPPMLTASSAGKYRTVAPPPTATGPRHERSRSTDASVNALPDTSKRCREGSAANAGKTSANAASPSAQPLRQTNCSSTWRERAASSPAIAPRAGEEAPKADPICPVKALQSAANKKVLCVFSAAAAHARPTMASALCLPPPIARPKAAWRAPRMAFRASSSCPIAAAHAAITAGSNWIRSDEAMLDNKTLCPPPASEWSRAARAPMPSAQALAFAMAAAHVWPLPAATEAAAQPSTKSAVTARCKKEKVRRGSSSIVGKAAMRAASVRTAAAFRHSSVTVCASLERAMFKREKYSQCTVVCCVKSQKTKKKVKTGFRCNQ